MKKKTAFILIGLSLILVNLHQVRGQSVGESAPDFKYRSLSGDSVALSDYAGKVVFLFLFGNTCPFCIAIGNDTETRIHDAFKTYSDFQAIGLDLWDGSSSVTTVNAFKTQTGISYPLLLRAGSMESLYSTIYDRAIVIDQAGVIRHKGTTRVVNDIDNAIQVIQSLLGLTYNDELDPVTDRIIESFPNPVRDQIHFKLNLKSPERVTLKIYNSSGQEITRLADRYFKEGKHEIISNVSHLPGGMYYYSLRTAKHTYTSKVLIMGN